MCLHRTPISGRNFEYFSEDPYLTGVMGVEVTKSLQKHPVIAMAKHYVVNDQEYERAVDTTVSDGTTPVTVSATVTNTGDRAGAEVVQVYLGIPVKGQPPKRLVGFRKVFVEPGESRQVAIVIDPVATNYPFGVWSDCSHDFVVKPGAYTVYVGTSADDTPNTFTVTVS